MDDEWRLCAAGEAEPLESLREMARKEVSAVQQEQWMSRKKQFNNSRKTIRNKTPWNHAMLPGAARVCFDGNHLQIVADSPACA